MRACCESDNACCCRFAYTCNLRYVVTAVCFITPWHAAGIRILIAGVCHLSPLLALCVLVLHLSLLAKLRLGQFRSFDFRRICVMLILASRCKDQSVAVGHLSARRFATVSRKKINAIRKDRDATHLRGGSVWMSLSSSWRWACLRLREAFAFCLRCRLLCCF